MPRLKPSLTAIQVDYAITHPSPASAPPPRYHALQTAMLRPEQVEDALEALVSRGWEVLTGVGTLLIMQRRAS